ncbi:MAG TPA: hypothetical protein VIF83_10480 [Gemmatimonadaceae bacterium]
MNDTYTFEAGVLSASAGSAWGTDLQPGAAGVADGPNIETAPAGQKFLGRFENTRTNAVLNLPNGYTNWLLTLDLYIIGSWDGKGKQAQHGIFLANVFSVSYRCGSADPVAILRTTFSNQYTVQQDYPKEFGLGGYKAGTGSYGQDLLNYISRPDLSNTPQFRSFGDTEYTLTFGGTNPCGTNQPVQFIFSTSNPTQQSVWDESWGVDNVTIKAGT